MAAVRVSSAAAESLGRLATLKPAFKVVVEIPNNYVPLRSDTNPNQKPETNELERKLKATIPKHKSFKLHVGGNLSIPSADAQARPQYSQPAAAAATTQAIHDPFEGLPFRNFAERVGEAILPALRAAREEQRRANIEGRLASETAQPVVPHVPHVLPFTRWAANSDTMRSTFIAEDPATRKKARLSWYHPEDTMVPRDWFKGGLLEDLKYYNPFGLIRSAGN